ncbi:methylmalonyl Co-A mutase-associated GTPase MeaB [Salinibacillus xinjiangensis]|uniref:Methylmalonyl Co-A mutase-associated GTPase MeaB n=1 Tax=Salinibacillus xinjiangensis TaxID=1229268 RepID=A0A6G1X5F3_9BACI|nr:methylmalonyl Co-A mutase-associated GTPase MeaB [Salinibacillus xinjiangensis]MRG86231.1 methylmalonyl Co-A mutase-associated GTPase MeaB [Salinibacillus xinjiangensis]
MHSLAERIQKQDQRALARAISMVENDHPEKLELLSDIASIKKKAYYVGITGSPGAGKSSLVDRLVTHLREQNLTVAVIAVDPTSPFSGGALLGDRVRMHKHFTDPGVFIRSMATRGSLGGLARSTKDAIRVCDAYGFDCVLVETVGVGQSELDIMKVVDSTAVVLTPNSGDVLQIFKAGIMEIADLFIINKADLSGVQKLRGQLKDFLHIIDPQGWKAPIVETISTENKGIEKLWKKCTEHRDYLFDTEEGQKKRQEQLVFEVYELMREELWKDVQDFIESDDTKTQALSEMADPYKLASKWLSEWKNVGVKKDD